MKSVLFIFAFLSFLTLEATNAPSNIINSHEAQIQLDSTRTAALDRYWKQLAKTVKEGDYAGYKALYHPDAVIVFAGGKNKASMSISQAMDSWQSIFDDTKAGKIKVAVDFRFSQRIGNEITAHETGIFAFSNLDDTGTVTSTSYVHFEMLFVKGDSGWLALMEHQKAAATQQQWDALK